jgi:hypothetical protein
MVACLLVAALSSTFEVRLTAHPLQRHPLQGMSWRMKPSGSSTSST